MQPTAHVLCIQRYLSDAFVMRRYIQGGPETKPLLSTIIKSY